MSRQNSLQNMNTNKNNKNNGKKNNYQETEPIEKNEVENTVNENIETNKEEVVTTNAEVSEELINQNSASESDIPTHPQKEIIPEEVIYNTNSQPTVTILNSSEVNTSSEEDVNEDVKLHNKLSHPGQILFNAIRTYIKECDPTVPYNDINELANKQTRFAKTILSIVNNTIDSDFNLLWGYLLKMFHKHEHGTLKDTMVYRVVDNLQLNNIEKNGFIRLLNLLLVTRDPVKREIALKTFNWNYTLGCGCTEAGKQRIFTFYNS
jgi:hypothetical protein